MAKPKSKASSNAKTSSDRRPRGETDEAALIALARSVGGVIEYWGFKSLHGQVWALIYLSEKPITTAQIIERLQMSKASISLVINDLMRLKLINLAQTHEFGAQSYVACDDIASVVLKVLRERELMLLRDCAANCSALAQQSETQMATSNVSKERVAQMSQMIETASQFLQSLVAVSESRGFFEELFAPTEAN
jgi:DNA-binding transcriptional regulator GbsR (MarR family)